MEKYDISLLGMIQREYYERGSPPNFKDVMDFHKKFGVGSTHLQPRLMERDIYDFRMKFLKQELVEIEEAYLRGDLVGFFDGLIDLVYVALGTADLASLPWQPGWNIVQWANMAKERAKSVEESLAATGRGHRLDVIKPPDWLPPDPLLKELLINLGADL